ncbi:MAG: hypothetical protein ACFFC7_07365 [Candidatus Hermodarchaeota archaeon]
MVYQEKNEECICGVILTRIEDDGPKLIHNASDLDEGAATMLAIQSFTMVSLGQGAPEGLYGPIPVPQAEDFQALIYTFLTSGVDSADLRVQEYGRQNGLFMTFPKNYLRYDSQIMDSLKAYIKSYLAMGELTAERIEILREQIISSAIFNMNVIVMYQDEIKRLKNEITRLNAIIEKQKEKISEQ